MEYVFLILVFLLTAGLTLGGYLLLVRRARRVAERLRADAPADSAPELLLGGLTPALAEQIPIGAEDRTDLQRELRSAGYYRPTALMEYAALRVLLVLVPLIAAGALALFTDSIRAGLYVWGGGLVVALLGYSLPRIYLYLRGRARMQAIEHGLPTAIDMLTLCLGAGLNVLGSLRRVAHELHFAFPVLADELEIVSRQAELRTLEFALAQFAERVGLPQLRNIWVILSQSENLGTDAVSILREYADNLRVNLRQRADELANRAPFKLLFPAYLMAFGAAVLLISPVALEFEEFRRANVIGSSLRRAQEVIRPTPPATNPTP